MGNLLVLILVVLAVFYGARSILKDHREGGCGSCSGCSRHCSALKKE